jgi:hypothetical protein
LPESQLARIFTGTLTEQEIWEISALQLWREKELSDTWEHITKKSLIQRMISPSNPGQPSPVMDYVKMAQKSSQLSDEEKMELNKLRVSIGKR